jgi:hypothetical protein
VHGYDEAELQADRDTRAREARKDKDKVPS